MDSAGLQIKLAAMIAFASTSRAVPCCVGAVSACAIVTLLPLATVAPRDSILKYYLEVFFLKKIPGSRTKQINSNGRWGGPVLAGD